MVSKTTQKVTNGDARRRCPSWINEFVAQTENTESPVAYRRWAAITAIGAVLEQHVWVTTSTVFFPHLYTFLVGDPGTGKSRAISAVMRYVREITDLPLGATSMTMASMVDLLDESKKNLTLPKFSIYQYNTMFIAVDELSAFMHEYDKALIAGLTAFYDVEPYHQTRRTKELSIKIERPQLSILAGTATGNLIHLIPVGAWTQGFMSRVIMVFSEDRPLIDVFNAPKQELSKDLIHDLRVIASIQGELGWTKSYANAMKEWREAGMRPTPNHPKLQGYCARRFAHLIKLTMIAYIDRGGEVNGELDLRDFMLARGWLVEAEKGMPRIFDTAVGGFDSEAVEELKHYVITHGPAGADERNILRFGMRRFKYAIHVKDVVQMLIAAGEFKVVASGYGSRAIASTKTFTHEVDGDGPQSSPA
jgi:hypothetical protein